MSKCLVCGSEITEGRNKERAKYCSLSCRKSAVRGGGETFSKMWGVSTSSVGAVGELIVSVDLLKRGWEVFRALSPNGCDLMVWKDGRSYRVEVKTGYIHVNGHIFHSGGTSVSKRLTNRNYDILAVVLQDGVIYDPDVFTNKKPDTV